VLAYDKDPLTGIVRHLDDQCIGCQYCVMKCPYDVPKYSPKRGIVRKCDMCSSRLAVGEAPACVQACPSEAIRIVTVNQVEITAEARRKNFLPGAPDSSYTLPTTRYKSSRPMPLNLVAGDHAQVKPSASHLPLVLMLALTQLSVGASVAAIFAEPARLLAFTAAAVSAVALGIASLHLGKPLKAWRSFLGWRKSWFSREVIVFSAFPPLAAAAGLIARPADLFLLFRIAAAVAGLAGVACSAMIYVDTQREFWRASQCFGKFFGTVLLLGAATTLAVEAFTRSAVASLTPAIILLMAATVAKLVFEHRIFRQLADENTLRLSPLNKTARLLEGRLGLAARWRVACGIFGGIVLPVWLIAKQSGNDSVVAPVAGAALLFCLAGELLERYLFFTAVAPVKMPGGVAV
jgi:DMSO reductase anchor subunit/ferredoxin